MSPKAGETVTVNVTIRNMTGGAAEDATLSYVAMADRLQIAQRQTPISVAGRGVASDQWQIAAPKGTQFTVRVTITHPGDTVTTNNAANVAIPITASRERG
jgi:hypothetical protein